MDGLTITNVSRTGLMLSAVLLMSGCATAQKSPLSTHKYPQLSETKTHGAPVESASKTAGKAPVESMSSNSTGKKAVLRISDDDSGGVMPASYTGPAGNSAAAPCASSGG